MGKPLALDTDSTADLPWAIDHQLNVLHQQEGRPGAPAEGGGRWMDYRTTGKSMAVCTCGYTSGLVDTCDLPDPTELHAQHPTALDAAHAQLND